jgi:hypothetical protein
MSTSSIGNNNSNNLFNNASANNLNPMNLSNNNNNMNPMATLLSNPNNLQTLLQAANSPSIQLQQMALSFLQMMNLANNMNQMNPTGTHTGKTNTDINAKMNETNSSNSTNPLFGVTDPLFGSANVPGFSPAFFNPFNPWMLAFQQPGLMNTFKQLQPGNQPGMSNDPLQQMSHALSMNALNNLTNSSNANNLSGSSMPNLMNLSNVAQQNNFSFPNSTTGQMNNNPATVPALSAFTSTGFTGNNNTGGFPPSLLNGGANTAGNSNLTSFQLPNLSNVTMASKIANNLASSINSDFKLNNAIPTKGGIINNNNNNSVGGGYNYLSNSNLHSSFQQNDLLINNRSQQNTSSFQSQSSYDRQQHDEGRGGSKKKQRTSLSGANSAAAVNYNKQLQKHLPQPILSHALIQNSLLTNRFMEISHENDNISGKSRDGENESDDDDKSVRRSSRSRKVPSSRKIFDDNTFSRRKSGDRQSFSSVAAAITSTRAGSFGKSGTSALSSTVGGASSLDQRPSKFVEDVIDLRTTNTGKKRIFIDFTQVPLSSIPPDENDPTHHLLANNSASHPSNLNFLYGYFHGKLLPNEECTNFKFGNHGHCDSPKTLPSEGGVGGGRVFPSGSYFADHSGLLHLTQKQRSRVGPNYQAEIPAFLGKKSLRKPGANAFENRIWVPSMVDDDDLRGVAQQLTQKKKEWKPIVGNIYSIYLDEVYSSMKYKLVAITEVNTLMVLKPGKKIREKSVQINCWDGEKVKKAFYFHCFVFV